MSFLQPFLLWGLALAAIPVIIHLIHQRRFRTVNWGAMYFLRKAKQNARGMARLKQWLILAMRTLAILALALAVSRPLAGGWMGQAGAGNLPMAIVLLDRSPSMEHRVGAAGETKREAGLRKIIEACSRFEPSRVVLIDSVTMDPVEVDQPDDLLEIPETGPVDKSANWPAMLQKALEYVESNRPGNCQVWMCSDFRANDWDVENGLWSSIRDEFPNITDNIQLLLIPMTQPAEQNLGIRVESARRIEGPDSAAVQIAVRIWKDKDAPGDIEVPLDVNLNGNVTRSSVTLSGREAVFDDISVSMDLSRTNGWGWVQIPTDPVPSDNRSFFAYQPFLYSRTLLVNEDGGVSSPLVWMSESAPDGNTRNSVQVVTPQSFTETDLSGISLILWLAPLPEWPLAEVVTRYLENRGQLVFFPPRQDNGGSYRGFSWGPQIDAASSNDELVVEQWKTDTDLLAHARDGTALPVGELVIRRYRTLTGAMDQTVTLARLSSGAPLVAKLPWEQGQVYFCATRPEPAWSSFSSNGVVLYVMVQRALTAGLLERQGQNMRVAGEPELIEAARWSRLAGDDTAPSTLNGAVAGVYEQSSGKFVAINRGEDEDASPVVALENIQSLMDGLPLQILGTGEEDAEAGVVQEIWRVFLLAMIAALLFEAWFSLPSSDRVQARSSKGNP
jgi:hypothetical protein